MKWFPDTAYWRVLQSNTESVDEPDNDTFKNPRAPTIPEEHAQYVPTKHDFDTHFDRPVFTGKHQLFCVITYTIQSLIFLGVYFKVQSRNTE